MTSNTNTADGGSYHSAAHHQNTAPQDWDTAPAEAHALEVVAAAAAAAAAGLQVDNSHAGFYASHHAQHAPAPPGVHEGVPAQPSAAEQALIDVTAEMYAAASHLSAHDPASMSGGSEALFDWGPLALANTSAPPPLAPGTHLDSMIPAPEVHDTITSSQSDGLPTGRASRARGGRKTTRSSGTVAEGPSSSQAGPSSSRSKPARSKKARVPPTAVVSATGKGGDDDDDDNDDDEEDDDDDDDDGGAMNAGTSAARGKRKAGSGKDIPSTVGGPELQQVWRSAIEARIAAMNQDSRHVHTTQKRFLTADAQLSEPASPCDSCGRNSLPCYLSPPHIKCCSCTLKGETCSFGLVRHSRKRKALSERDTTLRHARQGYIQKWRTLMRSIVTESRSRGAEDIAKLVEDRLGACINEMAEDLESWVPKDPILHVKPGKLQA
ncbi:unnamed protein product [Tilletia laevis]|uniref:Zn(2)-C6 fungal-type domain-containing protein n=3 Tax=Tilletia TaxID=13289 RepID=A0A8X7MWU0_9BASI|nr:hypothetical protein CF336_g624 [Tilletia laevis]KAE8202294.1 hypothetical protein CF328_g2295 [Tilletia controversa]KAE8263139.1 hypothetical protein A4X03_0g1907 [Tilletia caries]KAE8206701.1 hypothetical protein CF335_g1680 [Tilletia laevis]KAE8250161.1 hypothetical protein A4X06_0g2894 [Tilletia controversa]